MKYTTREEVYEPQRKHGVPEHSHLNGLSSCYECACPGVPGKTLKQLMQPIIDSMMKELAEWKD